jgi:hypothetical protein
MFSAVLHSNAEIFEDSQLQKTSALENVAKFQRICHYGENVNTCGEDSNAMLTSYGLPAGT